MEEKTKIKYISEMLNKRTKGKDYENFVINQIYARIDNPELEIVTQKCVRPTKSIDTKNLTKVGKNHYLIDLYFPQINFAIEVDEGHHENIENQFNDKQRENFIKGSVSCDIKRIKICKPGTKIPQNYDDIIQQIKEMVVEIKGKISEWEKKNNQKLKWITNDEKIKGVKNCKVFDACEAIHFGGITKVLNLLPGIKHSKLYQRCVKNFDIYSIWIPVLSVRLDDGTVKTANGWKNFINEDKDEIIEYPSDEKYNRKLDTYKAPAGSCPPKWGSRKRVVFMKMKDDFGNSCCRFLGVFKSDHIEYERGKQKRVYKRIATTIAFDEILKKN
jgi:very-short-patch-repair endonuclease